MHICIEYMYIYVLYIFTLIRSEHIYVLHWLECWISKDWLENNAYMNWIYIHWPDRVLNIHMLTRNEYIHVRNIYTLTRSSIDYASVD